MGKWNMLEDNISGIKLCIIFLATIGLLAGGVSASTIKTDEGCDTNDIKEEIVGPSPDGKNVIVKGTIIHRKNKANGKSSKRTSSTIWME